MQIAIYHVDRRHRQIHDEFFVHAKKMEQTDNEILYAPSSLHGGNGDHKFVNKTNTINFDS